MKYLTICFLFSFSLLNLNTIQAQTNSSLTREERVRWIKGQEVQKAFGIIDTIDYSRINPKRPFKVPSGSAEFIRKQAANWGRDIPNESNNNPISQKEKILEQRAKIVREAFGIDF